MGEGLGEGQLQTGLPHLGQGTLPGQNSTGEAFGLHMTGGTAGTAGAVAEEKPESISAAPKKTLTTLSPCGAIASPSWLVCAGSSVVWRTMSKPRPAFATSWASKPGDRHRDLCRSFACPRMRPTA